MTCIYDIVWFSQNISIHPHNILGLIAFSGPHLLELYARIFSFFLYLFYLVMLLQSQNIWKKYDHIFYIFLPLSSFYTWVMLLVLHPLPRAPTHWPLTLVCLLGGHHFAAAGDGGGRGGGVDVYVM